MNLLRRECYGNSQEMDEELQWVVDALRTAFTVSPAPFSPFPEKKGLSAEEQRSWQILQEVLPRESIGYADVTCLLAYSGIDYARNARRLMRPCTFHSPAGSGSRCNRGKPGGKADDSYLPGHLARVYDRWRDPLILQWLLGPHLPGKKGRAAGHQALACLWDDHRAALLSAAATSSSRRMRLANAVLYACRILDEPLIWRAYARHLRHALHSRELPMRRVALRLLTYLRNHTNIRADESPKRVRRVSSSPLVGL